MFVFLIRRVPLLSAVVVGLPLAWFAFVYYGTDYRLNAVGCQPGPVGHCDWEHYPRALEIEGLNRPFFVQFADYVCGGLCVPDAKREGVVRGDLGGHYGYYRLSPDAPDGARYVYHSDHDTSNIIIRASLRVSAQLGLAALVILYAVGVPLGTLAAVKRGAWIDRWIAVGCTAVKSVPVFVLGPVLMIVVVLRLEIMDPPGWEPGYQYRHWLLDQGPLWEGLFSASSILPVVVVALVAMPLVVRTTRAGVIDALCQDYVRTARAKGLPERMVITRHVIRHALTPLVSGLVPTLAALLSGLLLVEVLFGIHGLAATVINSLGAPDGVGGQTVLAGVVVGAAAWAVCSLAADLLHWALDPRIRHDAAVSRSGTPARALAV